MSESLEAAVLSALARITNPRVDTDLISSGMVRDLTVTPDGGVSFTILLASDDPATLVRHARTAVESVDGVVKERLKIAVKNPGASAAPAGAAPAPAAPPSMPPPPTPVQYPNLGKIIAISSGKGGVGKSTVAANLAVVLAQTGHSVGLMDADIYGPNVPRMFGVSDRPPVVGGRIQPLDAHGVKLMSLGFLVERDAPAIWRGPIIMKVVQQFLRDVDWGKLDYLVVDLPPGTGDAQLSLVQATHVDGAVIVTTPQEVSVGDALRGAKMFERVGVPVIGIVENMSGYTDPETGRRIDFFSTGGGKRLADELGVPFLGEVPLQPGIAELADAGQPVTAVEPGSPAGQSLRRIAETLQQKMAGRRMALPVIG